jgi:hypothetical protein
MGYDQVDAHDQFAPMINPLRGTRGLEGKGRKWHTSTDIDGLVRHLSDLGHSKVGQGMTRRVYARSEVINDLEPEHHRS